MPRKARAIPDALTPAVLARFDAIDPSTGRQHTSRAVAAWLGTAHGLHVSHMAVLRVRAAASEKGDALIVAALREELRDQVAPAARKLKRALARLDTLTAKSKSVKDLSAATNATVRALHELAHLGGVAAPVQIDLTSGGQPLDIARARLVEGLARLAKEPEPSPAGEAPRDPPA